MTRSGRVVGVAPVARAGTVTTQDRVTTQARAVAAVATAEDAS